MKKYVPKMILNRPKTPNLIIGQPNFGRLLGGLMLFSTNLNWVMTISSIFRGGTWGKGDLAILLDPPPTHTHSSF